jgi:hypothetical protein
MGVFGEGDEGGQGAMMWIQDAISEFGKVASVSLGERH